MMLPLSEVTRERAPMDTWGQLARVDHFWDGPCPPSHRWGHLSTQASRALLRLNPQHLFHLQPWFLSTGFDSRGNVMASGVDSPAVGILHHSWASLSSKPAAELS
jgi:hypothetical protein